METPENSLLQTLKESDLASVGSDWAEIALDSTLREGLLKDIPIIGTLLGLGRTGLAIRDYAFLKKLEKFLLEMKDVSPADRAEMINRLEQDADYAHKVAEHIIIILDRLDNANKAKLVARAFKAYSQYRIDAKQLQIIISVIDRIMIHDLHHVPDWASFRKFPPKPVLQNFVNAGLAWVEQNSASTQLEPTQICKPFAECVLGDDIGALASKAD